MLSRPTCRPTTPIISKALLKLCSSCKRLAHDLRGPAVAAATHAITLRRKRGRWFHIRPIYLGVRLFFSFFTSLASFLAFFDLFIFLGHCILPCCSAHDCQCDVKRRSISPASDLFSDTPKWSGRSWIPRPAPLADEINDASNDLV